MKKCSKSYFNPDVCGMTILGERGQIVIPKEARKKLSLQAGDKLMIIEQFGKLILVPAEEVQEMVEKITRHLRK